MGTGDRNGQRHTEVCEDRERGETLDVEKRARTKAE